ncbi:MAG: hypothetical protein M3042_12110 [Actinomycetota bacterium]|nr:hypothetical protein [Actinomycetota bacterium]
MRRREAAGGPERPPERLLRFDLSEWAGAVDPFDAWAAARQVWRDAYGWPAGALDFLRGSSLRARRDCDAASPTQPDAED